MNSVHPGPFYWISFSTGHCGSLRPLFLMALVVSAGPPSLTHSLNMEMSAGVSHYSQCLCYDIQWVMNFEWWWFWNVFHVLVSLNKCKCGSVCCIIFGYWYGAGCLTHWSLGCVEVILKVHVEQINSWALFVKLLSSVCYWTPLIKHWFR